MAPMRENHTKATLLDGRSVIGTMVQDARNPSIAQILADVGFDFMFIDMEHGAYDLSITADIILAARLAGITPLVRVPDSDYAFISRVLDAGAQGIMVPRVESRAQAERIVSATKYPPHGVRGCSIARGHNDYRPAGLWEFTRWSNDQVLAILQIERKRAIEDIEELASVEGVDVLLVGPNDLTLSMAEDSEFFAVQAAVERVIRTAELHGIVSGIHVPDPSRAGPLEGAGGPYVGVLHRQFISAGRCEHRAQDDPRRRQAGHRGCDRGRHRDGQRSMKAVIVGTGGLGSCRRVLRPRRG